MVGRRREGFDTDNALENDRGLVVVRRGWNDTRAVDEVDTPGESDVLPDL